MKNIILFPIIVLIAIAGGAVLLYLESNLQDQDKVNNEVNVSLLEIEYLNSSLNQLVLRSRMNLDLNYDALAKTTSNILNQLSLLSGTHFEEQKIAGSLLQKRFDEFKSSFETKADHIENFKSSNSVLRNSDRYVPIVGKELIQISNNNGLTDTAQTYENIIIDTMLFVKQNDAEEVLDVATYTDQIVKSESVMPAESTIKLIEFSNHIETIGKSKSKTDGYMNQAISTDDTVGIQSIQNAWGEFQIENNSDRNLLKYYSIIYVVLILGLISLLIFRLRNSYKSLDNEVKLKTDQVSVAYEDLRKSEKRLAQSEKMASLGQLIAGIAHQVNTPLAFASSNVGIVKSKLASLVPLFESARKLGDAVISKNTDNIRDLVTQQVKEYSKIKSIQADSLVDLLDDSKEGLTEIKQTVEALTNHSHIDSSLFVSVSIDSVVKRALKMFESRFSERKVSTLLGGNHLHVHCVINQLLQVLVNLINNAFDATDEESGVISIKTYKNKNGFIELQVSDNGHGIDKENFDNVFEPFFTTKDVGEGTGLGLSVSHQIIMAHKGEISIKSDPGAETTFIITLPAIKEAKGSSELTLKSDNHDTLASI